MKTNSKVMEQSIIVAKILRSLPMRFNYVVCFIEESKDLSTLSIDELHGSLLDHEQRMIVSLPQEEQALKVCQEERSGRGRVVECLEEVVVEEEEEVHLIELSSNATNATSWDSFNMSVPNGKRKQIMQS